MDVVRLGPGGGLLEGGRRSRLGVRPHLLPRISPRAEERCPTASQDTVAASPPFQVDPEAPPLPEVPTNYAVDVLERLTRDYPDKEVRGLGLQVAGPGLAVFRGVVGKAVDQPQRVQRPGQEGVAWRSCMKEVALGRMVGPLALCPYQHARVLPTGLAMKNKYEVDEAQQTWRMTSDLSAVPPDSAVAKSVNDLCYQPDFLKAHMSAALLRDSLAQLFGLYGEGIFVWSVDIPSCFRQNVLHPSMRPLCVYRLEDPTSEPGTFRFFQDLFTPFGGRFAEWGHTAVLALVEWCLAKEDVSDVAAYVDNFFGLWHLKAPGLSPHERCERAEALFARLGIKLHECMVGVPLWKGLGWMWDVANAPVMVCMEDKFVFFSTRLAGWAGKPSLVFAELESAVGLMLFLAAGFSLGRAQVACLRGPLTAHATAAAAVGKHRFACPLTHQAQTAIAWWHTFFGTWDRRCPCVLSFGPVASFEVLIRVDASTEWGCGGWAWVRGSDKAFFFTHEWSAEDRLLSFVRSRESTGCLETYGVALAAERFAHLCEGRRVLVESDGQCAIQALQKAYSDKANMMVFIMRAWEALTRVFATARFSHVVGVRFNRVADLLSHGRVEEAVECMALGGMEVGIAMVLLPCPGF